MAKSKKDPLMRNLRRSGQQYQIRRQLPADVVEHFGSKWYVKNTGMSDTVRAARLHDLWLAELDQQIAEVRADGRCSDAELHAEYMATRNLPDDDPRKIGIEEVISAKADALEFPNGYKLPEDYGRNGDQEPKGPGLDEALLYYKRITGQWTPIDQHLEQFLRETQSSTLRSKPVVQQSTSSCRS